MRALASLRRLLADPAGWSARWYRDKDTYESVAVRSDLGRAAGGPPGPVGRAAARAGQRLARRLAETGWGDDAAGEPNPDV